MANISSIKKFLLVIIAFAALGLLVAAYLPGLYGPFVLDDLQSIEPAKLDTFSWQQLIALSLQNESGPLGRPFSIASFVLNNYFFGFQPFYYKAVNLGLHLLCGISITSLIYLLLTLIPLHRRFALPVSLITAFIWMFHPLQVSTVLYAVQRMTQLATLFTLLGLNTYLLGRLRLNSQQRHGLLLMGCSFLLFFPLAVLSKETGVLFPWYLLCIEYFLLKFRCPNQHLQYLLKHFHYLLSLTVLLIALLYYQRHLSDFLIRFSEKNMTVFDRIFTESKVLLFYLKLILLPRLSEMGLYHDDFALSTHFNISTIILFCLIVFIAFCRRKAPIIAFGLAWFFVSHIIESTILPLELVFEHRNYLALLGPIFIVSYYGCFFFHRLGRSMQYYYVMACIMIMMILVGLTYTRSIAWSTADNFLKEERLNHPQSARVHIEMANWFLDKQDYNTAFAELDYALKLQPYNAGIALHKLLIFCRANFVPNEIYAQAAIQLRKGTITPYVIMVFNTMVANMFDHQCEAIDKQKILELLQIACKNQFISYHPRYQAILYHLQAGIELLEKHPEKTRMLLMKSFETYPQRLDPLIEKAYLEINQGLPRDAQNTMQILNQHSHRIRIPGDKIKHLNHFYQNRIQQQ